MRTIIDLPKKAIDELAELCRREKISRAEAIRRAIAVYLGQQRGRRADAGVEAFGIWRNRKLEGREYEDRLRDEWADRESGR